MVILNVRSLNLECFVMFDPFPPLRWSDSSTDAYSCDFNRSSVERLQHPYFRIGRWFLAFQLRIIMVLLFLLCLDTRT